MQINAIRIKGVHKLTFLFFLFPTVKRRRDVSNLFYYILDHTFIYLFLFLSNAR